jgi:hypothetical protein
MVFAKDSHKKIQGKLPGIWPAKPADLFPLRHANQVQARHTIMQICPQPGSVIQLTLAISLSKEAESPSFSTIPLGAGYETFLGSILGVNSGFRRMNQ